MDCIFCKILNKEIPSYKIYEDEYTYAFLDIANDVDGHTLVIPKKHCTNTLDADSETLHHVIDTVKLISNHYVNVCGYTGVNILSCNGEDSGQSVFHLHYHIFPRIKNDGKFNFPKPNMGSGKFEEIQNKLKIN